MPWSGTCLSDGPRLVVSPDELDPVRVAQFETGEEGDGLDAEEAPVDVIAWRTPTLSGSAHSLAAGKETRRTEKQVVRVRRKAADPKNLDEVVELPGEAQRAVAGTDVLALTHECPR